MLVLQQIESKRLIVEIRQHIAAHFDEGIQRTHGARQAQIPAACHTVEDGLPRLMQPPARPAQLANALMSSKGRLHRPLSGHIAAQAQRRQQFKAAQIFTRALDIA